MPQLLADTGYVGTGPYAASAPGPIAVPEPTTVIMLLAGGLVGMLSRWRKRAA